MPKMFRVYYIDPVRNVKIYSCCCPAYWGHMCEGPENCVPFDTRETAGKFAAVETKMVAPSAMRFVEEYEETRPLAKYKDHIVPQEHLRYYTDRYMYVAI